MTMRKEEYVMSDGTRTTSRRRGSILVTPLRVRELAEEETIRIPAKYFVATAERESGFATNEVDTEPNAYVSEGLYQLSREEAKSVGMPDADLLDPVQSTRVFARVQERRLERLITAGGRKEPDIWAYLAIAHNQGTGAALKTIKAYGIDWAAYKDRNPTLIGMARYGDAVISGGERWVETEAVA